MKRIDLQIMGVSEVHWPNSKSTIADMKIIFLEDKHYEKGVGYVLDKETSKALLLAKIKAKPFDSNHSSLCTY